MGMDYLSGFEPEFRIAPKPPLVFVVLFSFVLVLGLEVLDYPRYVVDRAIALFLLLCLLTLVNWGLSQRHPALEGWLSILEMVIVVDLSSVALAIPDVVVVSAIPIALAVPVIGFWPAMVIAAGQTVYVLTLLLTALVPAFDVGAAVLSLVVVWGVMGVMALLWRALRDLTRWMNDYFQRGQEFLEQARDRKAELEQTLENLAAANRQLALANERSVALRTIAEDAQQSKTMFVANVSHELRTPLNMVIGLVELMVESPDIYDVVLPPKMQEDLNVVYRNCEHLSSMINDVLDLSRIESNRLVLHRERVELGEIIESCAAAVRPLMEKKGLNLQISLPDAPGTIFCDRVRIRQVLLNLLSNAARFTDEGGISIEVTQREREVLVAVTDTGAGIQPQVVKRIFEPFWQDPSQMWRERGTGLGLSISKRFVQLHGGQMWLDSELGSGTSVSFTLPISAPMEPTVRPASKIQADWQWRESSFIAGRLEALEDLTRPCIIVHDRTEALHPLFARYGNEVETVYVRDFGQLDQALQEHSARAVIVNAETCQELYALVDAAKHKILDAPLIGFCVPNPVTRALKAGALEYMTKPVTSTDMERALSLVGRRVKRVLVADDDQDFSQLLARMLLMHDSQLQIIHAYSGQETLRALERDGVDLLLLDVLMPDMSGWDVLEALGHRDGAEFPPTIFVSAQDPVDQPQRSEILVASVDGGLDFGQLVTSSIKLPELLTKHEPELDLEPA